MCVKKESPTINNLETPQTANTMITKAPLVTRYHHHPGLAPFPDMASTFIPKTDCRVLVLWFVTLQEDTDRDKY